MGPEFEVEKKYVIVSEDFKDANFNDLKFILKKTSSSFQTIDNKVKKNKNLFENIFQKIKGEGNKIKVITKNQIDEYYGISPTKIKRRRREKENFTIGQEIRKITFKEKSEFNEYKYEYEISSDEPYSKEYEIVFKKLELPSSNYPKSLNFNYIWERMDELKSKKRLTKKMEYFEHNGVSYEFSVLLFSYKGRSYVLPVFEAESKHGDELAMKEAVENMKHIFEWLNYSLKPVNWNNVDLLTSIYGKDF